MTGDVFLSDVRALTIRQPWADAVLEPDGKTIENRTAGFPRGWRGTLLVHSASAMSDRGLHDQRIQALWPGVEVGSLFRDRYWCIGSLLGAVDLVDVHDDVGCCRPWGESEYAEAGGRIRRSLVHLVLENPRRCRRPVPARGRVGLWRVDEDLLRDVLHELALA